MPKQGRKSGASKAFLAYRADVVRHLGRRLTYTEAVRVKNAYSHELPPETIAILIKSGRQR